MSPRSARSTTRQKRMRIRRAGRAVFLPNSAQSLPTPLSFTSRSSRRSPKQSAPNCSAFNPTLCGDFFVLGETEEKEARGESNATPAFLGHPERTGVGTRKPVLWVGDLVVCNPDAIFAGRRDSVSCSDAVFEPLTRPPAGFRSEAH